MGLQQSFARPEVDLQSAASIVVVDDEPDIADLLGYILGREGYRVLCASSAAEALTYLQYAPVDLIVTDYAMPDMDGAELLRTLSGQLDKAHIPVVVVSACLEAAVRKNCPTMHAFLAKPFKTERLLQVIRELLDEGDRR